MVIYEVTETYSKSLTSSRAPLFHDSNDTGYYLDPGGESNIGKIKFRHNINNSGSGAWMGRNHAYDTVELLGYGAEFMIGLPAQ